MDSNTLRFHIITRVSAIALTLFLLFYLASNNAFSLTVILVSILVIVQVATLIRYLDRTNKEILTFFEAIKNNDFSFPDPKKNEGLYDQYLREQFEVVIKKLRQSGLTKDARHQYLTTIVQHVGIGLITFNSKGEIQIMNIAAKRLLKTENIKKIEELGRINKQLVTSFKKLKTGGRELLIVEIGGEEKQLSIYAIELSLNDEHFKLISLQNIRTELEEKEMEAWQKLVRVLTHEIMNSVTPISSLATTVENDLTRYLGSNSENCTIEKEDLEDIHMAIQTIQRRSEGLIRFVNDFRSLTHTPEPKFQLVMLKDLFDQLYVLLKGEFDKNQVHFTSKVTPKSLSIELDPELIQQVLINMIQNAIQALGEQHNKVINLSAFQDDKNNTLIIIKDNGTGIDEEAQRKIFIPFFTTKRKGSGIGLSLSKQIMRQHHGSIAVRSKPDEGSEFILRF